MRARTRSRITGRLRGAHATAARTRLTRLTRAGVATLSHLRVCCCGVGALHENAYLRVFVCVCVSVSRAVSAHARFYRDSRMTDDAIKNYAIRQMADTRTRARARARAQTADTRARCARRAHMSDALHRRTDALIIVFIV